MDRICITCSATFNVPADEQAFLQRLGWTFGSETFRPPLPEQCEPCRSRLRVAHRNERYLYRNTSALSGKDVITIVSPDLLWGEPYKVYLQEEWHSDKWDPLSYGQEFDFTKPFFEQWAKLHKAVPRLAVTNLANENSDYTTGVAYSKNCYLINSSEYCEDCYYGKVFQKCKNCMDCSYIFNSELCYQCLNVYDSYNCRFLSFSNNCTDCMFSSNLRSCRNCCLCTNLTQKEYYFQNQPLTKEEYERRIAAIIGSFEKQEQMRKLCSDAMRGMVRKYANIVNAEGSTGDYIENAKNCVNCYDVSDGQDCKNIYVGVDVKDTYDCSNVYIKPELCYQILGIIEGFNSAYGIFILHCQNMLYCEYCFHCSDCFGCSGLERKKYCILNRQYTKEEYEALMPKIIKHLQKTGEWGRFFPAQYSPYGYNESVAQEYHPMSRTDAEKAGFHWRDMEEKAKKPASYAAPDLIKDVPDSVTRETLACAGCARLYKIIPQELAFCRTQGIPLPRHCPDCRYDERLKLRNPRKLWDRECMKCKKAIRTTYAPEGPETVYCSDCYLKEVY